MSDGMDELEARRRRQADQESAQEAKAPEPSAENELLGRLKASRRRRREAEDQLAAAVDESRRSRREATALEARSEALQARVEVVESELAAARRSLAREQKRSRVDRRNLERARAELREAREGAAELADVVERAAQSRSWRMGHGAMRALRRITFRPPTAKEDALESAAVELARLASREPPPGNDDA
jgi:hypothetical protein